MTNILRVALTALAILVSTTLAPMATSTAEAQTQTVSAPADMPAYYSKKLVSNAKLSCSGQAKTCRGYCGSKMGAEAQHCENECNDRKDYCARTGLFGWREGVSVWVGSRE